MYQYSRSFKRPYNLTIDIGAGGQTDVSPRSPIAPQPSPLTPRQRSPLTPLRSSFRLPPRSPHRPTPQSSSRSPCSVRTTSTTFFNPTYDSDAAPSSAGIEEWDRTYDSDSELIALEQEVNYNMSTFNSIVSGDVRTEDMTLEQIGQRFFEVSGYQGRPKQLEAIHIVACQRKALILIARTSFGKSLVFNMLPLLHPVLRGIVLVVIPLKHIARQQWERVNLYDRAKAFVYDKDHKSKLDRQRIAAGVYTHVFMSPEYILSVDFNDDVLRKEQFRQQLTAVAIDELHLVNDWRNFRCEFSELHVLRSRLPVHVPYLGVSATLDKKTLSIVRKDAGFDDCQLLKTSIDRPEISTYIIFMEGNQNNFEDLRRFFPINLESPPYDIPKTVFYFDSKIKLNSFIRLATDVWFPEWGYPAEAYRWIAGYHADMAEWDKQRLSSIFERPDCPEDSTQGSPIRFWGASEAYGTGADNPDIKNIINYLIPKNENAHAQRKGRLVRKGGKGKFFMVVPRWACTTADLSKNYARKNKPNQNPTLDSYIPEQTNDQYDSDQSDDSITQSQPVTGAALNQARALQREKEVPEYIELINSSCNRVCELKRYDDETYPGYESGVLSKPDSCCSGCNPTSEDIPAYRPYPSISKSDNFSEAYLTKKLTQWRNEKARLLYEKSHIPMSGASILSDRFLKRIVQHNTFILNPTALAQQCKDWTEREVYEEEIVAMCTAIRDRSPGTNIHDAWREQVYSKQQETARNKGHSVDVKGRPVLPVVETEKEILIRKRNERKSAWLIGMGLPVVDKPAKSRKSKAKASTSDSSQSTTSSSSQQELLGTANASAASRNQSSSQSQIERRPLSALSINTVRRLSQQSKGSSPSRSSRS